MSTGYLCYSIFDPFFRFFLYVNAYLAFFHFLQGSAPRSQDPRLHFNIKAGKRSAAWTTKELDAALEKAVQTARRFLQWSSTIYIMCFLLQMNMTYHQWTSEVIVSKRMRVRIGKVLLYGSGLATGGALLYTAHKSGYDPNNIGTQLPVLKIANGVLTIF